MKRVFLFIAIFSASLFSIAQTQQGYVRTLGRPEKAGEALGDVTIKVKGQHNAVNSHSDGNFEMVLEGLQNGDAYSLDQVRKSGYELNESDFIGRPLAFSDKVKLEIVMVSSAQLHADKRRIENNAYKTAEKNYMAQFDLLEKQLADNKISIEQYRAAIQDLQDKFEKYQSLIDGLAEHYAHTDYDLLDEKDREINICIENGELERADSLIRLLFDPIGVLERNIEALERIDQQISQASEELDKANADMAAVLKQQEKDAEYLYQLFTIASAKFDMEKAVQYIVTRAELDTTNVNWQIQAATFAEIQREFDISQIYFQRVLDLYLQASYPREGQWASILNDLGTYYFNKKQYNESQEAYMVASSIAQEPASAGDPYFTYLLANIQNNLANLYFSLERYSQSEELYKQVLKTRRKQAKIRDNDLFFETELAVTLEDYAGLCSKTRRFQDSESLYLEAIEIYERIENKNERGDHLANAYSYLSMLYRDLGRLSESIPYQLKALEIHRSLAKTNPTVYLPEVAETLRILAGLYIKNEQFEEAENCYMEVLDILKAIKDYAHVHDERLSYTLNGLAELYAITERDIECEASYKEALDIQRRLAKNYPEQFSAPLVGTLSQLAFFYYLTERFSESEALYLEALEITKKSAKANPDIYNPVLTVIYHRLGVLYFELGRNKECEDLFSEALPIERKMVKTHPSDYEMILAETLFYKGICKALDGNYSEAESYLKEFLKIFKRVDIDKNDIRFRDYYLDALDGLCQIQLMKGNYSSAYQFNQERINTIEDLGLSETPNYQEALVTSLSNQSFYCIFLKKYAEAERLASKAITLDPSNITSFTNLAAAFLFQGKYTEAEEIYRSFKADLKDGFLQDLDEFEAAGVIPKEQKTDVECIRKMLLE